MLCTCHAVTCIECLQTASALVAMFSRNPLGIQIKEPELTEQT